MFNFFKRKGGKAEDAGTTETDRREPNVDPRTSSPSVDARASRNENDVTNEKSNLNNSAGKDVVNLLIPETDYNQKTGVGALLQIMAGKRKKNKRKTSRTESVRVSPQKEMKNSSLQRSKSEREPRKQGDDVSAPTPAKNNRDAPHSDADPADFVKALVLQKYANKTPDKQHVSLVYVSNEPDLDEKRHAEALLREIAKSIDCTIDKINENKEQMGTTDSRNVRGEPLYETISERKINNQNDKYKNELKGELDKLLQNESLDKETERVDDQFDTRSLESPGYGKKSNLKPPRSDTEGCSDDDRSDCGKKRVTFRKHIVFDDGDQQTDEEVDSTFESLTSEEEEEEYLEDSLPDNDELLGGFVVSRNDENKTVISVSEDNNEVEALNKTEEGLKRISSDNSDSGFLDSERQESDDLMSEVKTLEESESESACETETESEEEIIEVIEEISVAEVIDPDHPKHFDNRYVIYLLNNFHLSVVN